MSNLIARILYFAVMFAVAFAPVVLIQAIAPHVVIAILASPIAILAPLAWSLAVAVFGVFLCNYATRNWFE